MRRTCRNKNRRRGGAATAFPLKYFDPNAEEPSAGAGHDLLKATAPLGVRPRIGGGRKRKTRRIKRRAQQKGGFVPSVMGGFVEAAAKYITPLALFAGYKLMTRKGKKGKRSTRRR
jgi:hypothetical protein